MGWAVEKQRPGRYIVRNIVSGEIKSHHTSRAKAEASVRARNAWLDQQPLHARVTGRRRAVGTRLRNIRRHGGRRRAA